MKNPLSFSARRATGRVASGPVGLCGAPPQSFRSISTFTVDNPYDGTLAASVPVLREEDMAGVIDATSDAQKSWAAHTSLEERIEVCERFNEHLKRNRSAIAAQVSQQMGKPVGQAEGELEGSIKRAKACMDVAAQSLADAVVSADQPLQMVRREPVGVVMCLVPWNYPLFCAINCVIPAVLAGNSVVLKHSHERSPLCTDHFVSAFEHAGAPKHLVSAFHVEHSSIPKAIAHPAIGFVSFTGSTSAGRHIYQSVASQRFIDVNLELGGKDPAYVASDANIEMAASELVSGATYNAGQSCCAVERVYVHHERYEEFIECAAAHMSALRLGDPMDGDTDVGPIAQERNIPLLLHHVEDAVAHGAKVLVGGHRTTHQGKGRFFSPTLLRDCTHEMQVMREESFGPLLPVQPVSSDAEAVAMMNDTRYGLTASIFTASKERAMAIGQSVNAGTIFMNSCDFIDPHLPWSGRQDSGKGVSLTPLGFNALTKPKAYNFHNERQ